MKMQETLHRRELFKKGGYVAAGITSLALVGCGDDNQITQAPKSPDIATIVNTATPIAESAPIASAEKLYNALINSEFTKDELPSGFISQGHWALRIDPTLKSLQAVSGVQLFFALSNNGNIKGGATYIIFNDNKMPNEAFKALRDELTPSTVKVISDKRIPTDTTTGESESNPYILSTIDNLLIVSGFPQPERLIQLQQMAVSHLKKLK